MSSNGNHPPHQFNFQPNPGNNGNGQRYPGFYDIGQPSFNFAINPPRPGLYDMNVNWTQNYFTGGMSSYAPQNYGRPLMSPPPPYFTFPPPANNHQLGQNRMIGSPPFSNVPIPPVAAVRPILQPARLHLPNKTGKVGRPKKNAASSALPEEEETDGDQSQLLPTTMS